MDYEKFYEALHDLDDLEYLLERQKNLLAGPTKRIKQKFVESLCDPPARCKWCGTKLIQKSGRGGRKKKWCDRKCGYFGRRYPGKANYKNSKPQARKPKL